MRGIVRRPSPIARKTGRTGRPDLQHKVTAPISVGCAVVTVSDSKTPATDLTGRILAEGLARSGHRVHGRVVVTDDAGKIRRAVKRGLRGPRVAAVITNGGTGITSRDVTFEAVEPMLEKRLDGFGELFRALSFRQIGPSALMSRALAGTVGRKVVIMLPGSPRAAELALKKLLLPELGHIAQQLSC